MRQITDTRSGYIASMLTRMLHTVQCIYIFISVLRIHTFVCTFILIYLFYLFCHIIHQNDMWICVKTQSIRWLRERPKQAQQVP